MNKKAVSLMLAGLIFMNLCGALPAISESEAPAASVEHSPDDRYYYDIAKDYFGIEDPYKMYDFSIDRSTILYTRIDNEFKKMFVKRKPISNNNIEFFDFFTDEKIFSSQNNYQNSYNYFDEGTEFEYIEITDFFTSYQQHSNRTIFDNIEESAEFSAVDLVRAMLEIAPIENWYAKDKEISLDDFEYKNIVPSTNDDKLIERNKLNMLVRANDLSGKDIPLFDKIVFLNVDYVYFEGSKAEEIFGGKEVEIEIQKDGFWEVAKKYKSDYLEEKNRKTIFFGEDLFRFCLQKYTRPLRQCIEVIDGVEYYNVGKLRKLYENLPDEVRYDYTTGPFRQPSDGETDTEQRRALRPGDRGEAVLAMKRRFYELGYFRTEKFNDQYTQNTADTVRLFEKNNGLPQDGIADAEMLALLFSDKAVGK